MKNIVRIVAVVAFIGILIAGVVIYKAEEQMYKYRTCRTGQGHRKDKSGN